MVTLEPIKVLLVDEDKDHLHITKLLLQRDTDLKIETTMSSVEAIRIIDGGGVDMVISDYDIPRINGLELLKLIREKHGDLPFIILTGKSREEVAIKALNLGADFYLEKRVAPETQFAELTNMIKQACRRRRAEQTLRESEALHRMLLDSSPFPISVNVRGRIVYANQKRAELTGHASPSGLVGQDFLHTVHPDDVEIIQKRINARERGEKVPSIVNIRFITGHGETRQVEVNSSDIMWLGENATIHFSRDVTEEKRLNESVEESGRRYRSLVEESPLPISVTAGDRILYVNPKRLELTGHTDRSELTGSSILYNIHPEDREYIRNRQKARAIGEDVSKIARFRMICADGSIIHVENHDSEAVWEGERAVIHSIIDVTDRMQYETRLKALHSHTIQIEKADSIDDVIKATYDALTQCLGYMEIDIIKVEKGVLRDVYPVREMPFIIPVDGPGITARAARIGETQLVTDTALDPDYLIGMRKLEMRSELTVPIKVDGEVEYLLNIESETPEAFTEEDKELVEILANYASSALEKIREQGRRQSYTERLVALHRSASELAKAETFREVGEGALSAVEEALGFSIGSFGIVEADVLRHVYIKSFEGETDQTFEMPLDGRGVTVRAVRTGKAQLVPDSRLDEDFVEGPPDDGLPSLSELAVPVHLEGKTVGVINVESTRLDTFAEADLRLLETLAEHVASAISRIREQEKRREYRLRLEALYRVTEAVTSATTIDEVARHVGLAVKEIIGYYLGSLALVEEGALHFRYNWGYTGEEDYVLPLDGPGITVRAVRTGETQLIRDTALDNEFLDSEETGGIRSELCIPVKVAGEVVAVVNVESLEIDAFGEEEYKLLSILAEHVGSTFHNIGLLERERGFTEKLEALHQSALNYHLADTWETIVERTMGTMERVLGFDHGSFSVVEGGVRRVVSMRGMEMPLPPDLPLNGGGITVQAILTGKTQIVPDTRLDENYVGFEETGEFLSELAVPVKIDGDVVGVINAESERLDAFAEADQRLLEILAEHVASALRNIRFAEERRRYEERLEALSTAMAAMNMCESLEELAEQTLAIVEEVIALPYSAFMMVEGEDLVTVQTKGAPTLYMRLPLNGKGLTVKAAREKKLVLVNNTRLDPDFIKGSTDSLSELDVPIIVDGKVVGVLNIESPNAGYFDASHVSLAEVLSAHAASNIERLWREEMEREAQRRVIEEKARADEARRLEEMKTRFISTATHEIRTPLTSIKGYTELVRMLLDKDTSQKLLQHFEVIQRNTDRLDKLTSELLDVQRIESGRLILEKKPLQLRELLTHVKEEMTPILEKRSQSLIITCDYAGQVTVDHNRVMQVLVNLVANSSRFSPDGAMINLNVEDRGGAIKVSVHDEGAGISTENMPKLFTPFPGIRVEGVPSGTGLGLSICKGIVEIHGGSIWAESGGLGKGSTFIFTLPK